MGDVERKREAIKAAYVSTRWREKVNAMSDAQVVAIFFNLRKQGKV